MIIYHFHETKKQHPPPLHTDVQVTNPTAQHKKLI